MNLPHKVLVGLLASAFSLLAISCTSEANRELAIEDATDDVSAPLQDQIEELEAQIQEHATDKENAVDEATLPLESRIDELEGQVRDLEGATETAVYDATSRLQGRIQELEYQVQDLERANNELESRLN